MRVFLSLMALKTTTQLSTTQYLIETKSLAETLEIPCVGQCKKYVSAGKASNSGEGKKNKNKTTREAFLSALPCPGRAGGSLPSVPSSTPRSAHSSAMARPLGYRERGNLGLPTTSEGCLSPGVCQSDAAGLRPLHAPAPGIASNPTGPSTHPQPRSAFPVSRSRHGSLRFSVTRKRIWC